MGFYFLPSGLGCFIWKKKKIMAHYYGKECPFVMYPIFANEAEGDIYKSLFRLMYNPIVTLLR